MTTSSGGSAKRARLKVVDHEVAAAFTAADDSVTFALNLCANHAAFLLSGAEQAHLVCTTCRDAYKRAFDRSHDDVAA